MFPTAPPADVRPNARGRYLEKCTEITTIADLYTNPEPRPKINVEIVKFYWDYVLCIRILCRYIYTNSETNIPFLIIRLSNTSIGKSYQEQESIPVGYIPPDCWPYPMVFQVPCLRGGDTQPPAHTHYPIHTHPLNIPTSRHTRPQTYPTPQKGLGTWDTNPKKGHGPEVSTTVEQTDTCEKR